MNDRLSPDDLAAMVRGANALHATLQKLWPQADPAELTEKAQQIEASEVACQLLHMLLAEKKLRVG